MRADPTSRRLRRGVPPRPRDHASGYQTRELTRGRLQRGGQGDGLWVRHGFHPEPVQDPAGHHGLHGAGDCAVRQGDAGQAPRGEQERVRPRG